MAGAPCRALPHFPQMNSEPEPDYAAPSEGSSSRSGTGQEVTARPPGAHVESDGDVRSPVQLGHPRTLCGSCAPAPRALPVTSSASALHPGACPIGPLPAAPLDAGAAAAAPLSEPPLLKRSGKLCIWIFFREVLYYYPRMSLTKRKRPSVPQDFRFHQKDQTVLLRERGRCGGPLTAGGPPSAQGCPGRTRSAAWAHVLEAPM